MPRSRVILGIRADLASMVLKVEMGNEGAISLFLLLEKRSIWICPAKMAATVKMAAMAIMRFVTARFTTTIIFMELAAEMAVMVAMVAMVAMAVN